MALNIVSIIAVFIMILSLSRDSLSYFKPFRNYFVLIYGAFLTFLARELVLIFYPDRLLLLVSTQLIVSAGVGIAILWGHLATRLYLHPEPFSIRLALANPLRPPYLFFLFYLIPMVTTLIVGWSVAPIETDSEALYLLDGVRYQSVGYSTWFLGLLLSVALAFITYPNFLLVHLRAQLKDREVRYALKVFASCFGAIAMLLLSLNALAAFGYSLLGLGHLIDVVILSVAVRAFRKPSFLKSFLGVVPSFDLSPTAARGDQIVVIYGSEEEKLGPFSRYVIEGIDRRHRVVYFHQGDEGIVREQLTRNGVNVSFHLLKGNLRLFPFGSLYQPEGSFDEKAALATCQELESDAKALGREALRVLVDYGDYLKRPTHGFVGHLTDSRWSRPDRFVNVLMAFDRRAFQGQENALDLLKAAVPVLDLAESPEIFSRTIGLSHSEIMGKKILLEYDPLSDYERVLKALLAEAASNLERIVVFTRRDSPVHSFVGGEPGLRMFILTSRVSYPQVVGENRVLLPAYDSSLLLDALDKTIEAYVGVPFTVMVDNISHFIFTLGRDRAYSLVRQALELMVSDKITAFFLLNSGAHDQKTISTFENLFDIELLCNAGARVPEVRKRLGVTAE